MLDDPLTAAYVAPERLDQLRRREPVIRTALDRLAALDLPPSIVHGDLHLGNTLLRDGEPVFIDWTDACVGPAMVDLLTPHETSDAQLKALWREAYMEEWSTIVPRPALDEALALNDIVLPLHHAVSYRSILANIEPLERGDLAGALADLLGLLGGAVGASGS
ncbi:MAG: aminoglycoside phosphotransferase family protein [Anaerolineae bacterium]